MAYDKRFGVDIPSDKQRMKAWGKHQFVLSSQRLIKFYLSEGKDELAFKWATLLAKIQKFDSQPETQRTTNVMFVTKFENEETWAKYAKQHSKRITEQQTNVDLATDTGKQSGVGDSDTG